MNNQIICIAKPTSEVLKIYPAYRTFFPRFYQALAAFHTVKVLDLPDIWVRDFLPEQNSQTGELVRLIFNPRYANYIPPFTAKINVAAQRLFPVPQYPVRLDGGNIVRGPDGIVFCFESRRIFRKSTAGEQAQKEAALKQALGARQVVWLAREQGDKINHIDGFMQFIGRTLFVSDERFDPYLKSLLARRLGQIFQALPSVEVRFLPCVPDESDSSGLSARGIYVNFLATSRAVFVPQYHLPQDQEVLAIIKTATDKPVVGIDCAEIARYGGAVHCLTKEYTANTAVSAWSAKSVSKGKK